MTRKLCIAGILFLCLHFAACDHSPQAVQEKPAVRPSVINPDPSSSYLSPQESMKTIQLPEGYHLELVASEPVIQEPVAIVWDGNGRMYVAEMRSYMQDINGTGEKFPISRITMLEDTNGDGVMDKHSIFIDSLLLPRMMLALDDRLVVNETYSYNLYSYHDTNGDGKADEKTLMYHNDTPDDRNLEHQKSGLVWNIDNWIYVTNPVRYRYKQGKIIPDSLGNAPSGQWGIANDDYGRLFFSFAGGEVPALGFQQNPAYGPLDLDDQTEPGFDEVWPIMGTPDVEGGKLRQRADSSLNHFTASCGQTIFRGDRLPESMRGDLFICEPAGRLIRRAKVINRNGKTILKNAYDKAEFLASTDMNFRPINTATGPDGCLYIVDMYHGIIQESQWTGEGSLIRPQILRKNLDKNKDRGRIYRVVHDGYKPGPAPHLLNASNEELLSFLSHPNGWWRDNAQKLLIIRNDPSVIPDLKKLALGERSFWEKLAFWKDKPPALARLHALWTLEGLQAIDKDLLLKAFTDEDVQVRKAAIRISEPLLKQNDAEILSDLEKLKNDSSADIRIQLILSLRYCRQDKARELIKDITVHNQQNDLLMKIAAKSLVSDDYLSELKAITADKNDFDRSQILDGAEDYIQLCTNCHGPQGKGLPSGIAPPLSGSARVNGDKDALIKILLHGLNGPVDGKNYPGAMLSMQGNSNEYIAAVLSYIRHSMGNNASMVQPADVRKIRAETKDRKTPWTLSELGYMGLPGKVGK